MTDTDNMAIEEIARIICGNDRDCRDCGHNSAVRECGCLFYAKRIYEQDYRKQSEGEWIKTETNYTCSKCNFNVISWSGEYDGYEFERGISLMKFCPNCGAKMKGGE